MKSPQLVIYLFAFFVLISCDSDPGFGDEPVITFLDITPREVKAISDSIIIRIEFTDGDGDLGEVSNLSNNLTIIDNRLDEFSSPNVPPLTLEQATINFSLPNLTPDTKNPSIQGIITIELIQTEVRRDFSGTRLPVDSTSYDIFVIDRSGNISNTITTDIIQIIR